MRGRGGGEARRAAQPRSANLRACAGAGHTSVLHAAATLTHPLRRGPPLPQVNHKNPLLAMLLPRWVEDKYPEAAAALRKNEQRLVTGYDFHTTMHHLLHLGESRAPPAEQYPQWQAAGNVTEAVRWGVSLLAEVPTGRSCDDAGVPPEFCQCRL